MHLSVASDGAFMAVLLSLVVTVKGKGVSVVILHSFLFLTGISDSDRTQILSPKTSLLTCQAAGLSHVLRHDFATAALTRLANWAGYCLSLSRAAWDIGILWGQGRRRKHSCSLASFSPFFLL